MNYLNPERSLYSALACGSLHYHCERVGEGTLGDRVIHLILLCVEAVPIIGQIAVIFEWAVGSCYDSVAVLPAEDLPSVEKAQFEVREVAAEEFSRIQGIVRKWEVLAQNKMKEAPREVQFRISQEVLHSMQTALTRGPGVGWDRILVYEDVAKRNIQAIALIWSQEDRVRVFYLASHPHNIRARINEKEGGRVQGAGGAIMQYILDHRGERAVSLSAYSSVIPFYERFGLEVENPAELVGLSETEAVFMKLNLALQLIDFEQEERQGEMNGVYIRATEEVVSLDEYPRPRGDTVHIGCGGWHNFDIMVQRGSDYGLIVDFNPENRQFMRKTCELLGQYEDRKAFVQAMKEYVSSRRALFVHRDQTEPIKLLEEELTREGSWLANDRDYFYIRELACANHIVAITGDIRNEKTFAKIRKCVDNNHVQVDTLYLSNIPDFVDCKASVSHLRGENTLLIQFSNQKERKQWVCRSTQDRRIPPISLVDTMGKNRPKAIAVFADGEIKEKLPIVWEKECALGLWATYTRQGKAILQQQATRGCMAATASMLIMDNSDQLADWHLLAHTNLATIGEQERWIQRAGLIPKITEGVRTLERLQALLFERGSAIVGIADQDMGAHSIIVDAILEDGVRIRDPYHGWEITITKEAFLRVWHDPRILQISTNEEDRQERAFPKWRPLGE